MKDAIKGLGCHTGSQSFSLQLVWQTLKILRAERTIIDTMFRNGFGFGYAPPLMWE